MQVLKKLSPLLALSLLFLLSESCAAINVAKDAAGGNRTAYLGKYNIATDSTFVDSSLIELTELDIKNKAFETLEEMGFYLYTENGTTSQWQWETSAISQRTTGKYGKSTWNMTHQVDSNRYFVNLRVYGNYKYGTKEKADAIVATFKRKLYGIQPEVGRKKNKSKD